MKVDPESCNSGWLKVLLCWTGYSLTFIPLHSNQRICFVAIPYFPKWTRDIWILLFSRLYSLWTKLWVDQDFLKPLGLPPPSVMGLLYLTEEEEVMSQRDVAEKGGRCLVCSLFLKFFRFILCLQSIFLKRPWFVEIMCRQQLMHQKL